jgi:hypothetical protein
MASMTALTPLLWIQQGIALRVAVYLDIVF